MRLWAAVGIGASLLACHRGGDEQASSDPPGVPPKTAAVAQAKGSDASLANRCVWPSPESPPPPAGSAAACPPDPEPHTLDLVTVQFPEATRGPTTIKAELARTFPDRERGLMYRTSMDEDRGMLFDMNERKVNQFWMRNTCIALDMIFLDDDGLIVGILENVPTLNERQRSVPCPSSYVLEVNAGWSRRNGVRAGTFARLPGA